MRKITENVMSEFYNGIKAFTRFDNTEIIYEGDIKSVFLHGNKIFWKNLYKHYFCLCGWDTVTTRERLNGLLKPYDSYIHRKRGQLYYTNPVRGVCVVINAWDVYEVLPDGNIVKIQ